MQADRAQSLTNVLSVVTLPFSMKSDGLSPFVRVQNSGTFRRNPASSVFLSELECLRIRLQFGIRSRLWGPQLKKNVKAAMVLNCMW